MSKKPYYLLLVGVMMVLVMALAACGGGESQKKGEPATPTQSSASDQGSTQANTQANAQANTQANTQELLALGHKVFETNCAGCHSAGTEKRVGPPLAGISTAVLSATGQIASRESLKTVIQQGSSVMPGNMIKTEKELEALLLYLESL